MDKSEESYVNYLKSLVRSYLSRDHEVLLDRLWRKEFYSVLPNDQNRAKDGIFLRDVLGEDVNYGIFGPCRVLEMLIALSKRMEFNLEGTDCDEDYVDLFWEMLGNLDILQFDNLAILEDAQTLQLDHILTDWLDRKYSSDGSGGIFPLKNWTKNGYKRQNKVELWYQMMSYLCENYEF